MKNITHSVYIAVFALLRNDNSIYKQEHTYCRLHFLKCRLINGSKAACLFYSEVDLVEVGLRVYINLSNF